MALDWSLTNAVYGSGLSHAPLSSCALRGLSLAAMFVVPHAADDSVGEVALVGAAGLASGLAFAEFPVDVHAGIIDIAMLGDADDVEHAVDSPVAAEVESMPDG